jgi:hypothetical protein
MDHRNIKSRTNVMLGFKRVRSAATTISGVELAHRIRKGQFDFSTLGLKGHRSALGLECGSVKSIRYPYLFKASPLYQLFAAPDRPPWR